jgi:hypothetical protein
MPNTKEARSTESTANAFDNIKTATLGLFSKLRRALQGMGFWKMALLCFVFRYFVLRPLGAVLALLTGTLWCIENTDTVRRFFHMIHSKVQGGTNTDVTSSLWYENGGREKIEQEIQRVTSQEERFCNLAECIHLPPASHWPAIARSLSSQGIQTQVSGDAFYIALEPSGKQE